VNAISDISTVWTIWLGLIGQTLFVSLYLTRPWRYYRITRAYLMKSVALQAIFLRSALLLHTRGLRSDMNDPAWVALSAIALNAFVLFAIWYQLFALVLEIRRASLSGEPPPGVLNR
jgi:hypothetical protein